MGDRCKQQAVTTAMKSKSNGKGWQGAGSLIPEQLPEHSLREDHSRLRNWQGHCGHRGLSKAWRQEREGGTQGLTYRHVKLQLIKKASSSVSYLDFLFTCRPVSGTGVWGQWEGE